MKRNYFDYNGKRYYTGTVLVTQNLWHARDEITFICYDTETNRYSFKIQDKIWCYTEMAFYKAIVEIASNVDINVHMPQVKKKKDSQVNGLALGWMWYIFLMAIVTIFKDNVGLWILISVVFFNWRAEKIKKEGTYIEW